MGKKKRAVSSEQRTGRMKSEDEPKSRLEDGQDDGKRVKGDRQ
jgi:hypothetical protein